MSTENKLPELIPAPHSSPFRYDDFGTHGEPELMNIEAIRVQLNRAQEIKCDYVYPVGMCSCATCSKYRNRIYSISGNDKRFPKLPEFILKYSWHCRLLIYHFYLGLSFMSINESHSLHDIQDLIEISNRPFIDDRADEELDRYKNLLNRRKQQFIDELNSKRSAAEYEQIEKILPEFAPKGKGAYLRMKKSNSDNYAKIVRVAEMANITIRNLYTLENLIQEQIADEFFQYSPEFLQNDSISISEWNAECRRYRIRWNEQKPRFDVTIFDGEHREMMFCNSVEEAIAICKQ